MTHNLHITTVNKILFDLEPGSQCNPLPDVAAMPGTRNFGKPVSPCRTMTREVSGDMVSTTCISKGNDDTTVSAPVLTKAHMPTERNAINADSQEAHSCIPAQVYTSTTVSKKDKASDQCGVMDSIHEEYLYKELELYAKGRLPFTSNVDNLANDLPSDGLGGISEIGPSEAQHRDTLKEPCRPRSVSEEILRNDLETIKYLFKRVFRNDVTLRTPTASTSGNLTTSHSKHTRDDSPLQNDCGSSASKDHHGSPVMSDTCQSDLEDISHIYSHLIRQGFLLRMATDVPDSTSLLPKPTPKSATMQPNGEEPGVGSVNASGSNCYQASNRDDTSPGMTLPSRYNQPVNYDYTNYTGFSTNCEASSLLCGVSKLSQHFHHNSRQDRPYHRYQPSGDNLTHHRICQQVAHKIWPISCDNNPPLASSVISNRCIGNPGDVIEQIGDIDYHSSTRPSRRSKTRRELNDETTTTLNETQPSMSTMCGIHTSNQNQNVGVAHVDPNPQHVHSSLQNDHNDESTITGSITNDHGRLKASNTNGVHVYQDLPCDDLGPNQSEDHKTLKVMAPTTPGSGCVFHDERRDRGLGRAAGGGGGPLLADIDTDGQIQEKNCNCCSKSRQSLLLSSDASSLSISASAGTVIGDTHRIDQGDNSHTVQSLRHAGSGSGSSNSRSGKHEFIARHGYEYSMHRRSGDVENSGCGAVDQEENVPECVNKTNLLRDVLEKDICGICHSSNDSTMRRSGMEITCEYPPNAG